MTKTTWAIVKNSDGVWHATPRRDDIIASDPDDVLFAETVGEAIQKLDTKYPAPHLNLSRVCLSGRGYDYGSQMSRALDADIKFTIVESPGRYVDYNGCKDFQCLVATVAELKEVKLDASVYSRYQLRARGSIRKSLQDAGISIRFGRYYYGCTQLPPRVWYTLKWNPKGVKAALKAAETKRKNERLKHPDKTRHIANVFVAMQQLCRKSKLRIGSIDYLYGDDSYLTTVEILAEEVVRFNTLFGHNKHRCLSQFHALVKAWPTCIWRKHLWTEVKKHAEEQRGRSPARIKQAEQEQKRYIRLLKWLDRECRQKMPRASTPKKMCIAIWKLPLTESRNGKEKKDNKSSKGSKGNKAKSRKLKARKVHSTKCDAAG